MMDLSARSAFIVAYDVADQRRLVRVAKVIEGYGRRLQRSVFRCDLTARELVELRAKLSEEINASEDQVLFIDLGPVDGRGGEAISSLGMACEQADSRATVI